MYTASGSSVKASAKGSAARSWSPSPSPARRKSGGKNTKAPSRSPSPGPPDPLVGPVSSSPRALLTVSAANPPFERCAVVTGGTGFMGSFLVQQLDAVAVALDTHVHYLDVVPPRPDMPSLRRSTFHHISLIDADAVEDLFRTTRPDTVFHAASMIDCRPRPVPQLDAVNIDGTALIIDLCLEFGVKRLVYTSSIEVTYHDNRCENVHFLLKMMFLY